MNRFAMEHMRKSNFHKKIINPYMKDMKRNYEGNIKIIKSAKV